MFAKNNRRSVAGSTNKRSGIVREPITKSASICIEASGQIIACTLRDIHKRGARLSVVQPHGIPDNFVLKSRSENIESRAMVAWRRGNELGVKFV